MPHKYKPIPKLTQREIDRFWSKVNIAGPDECWLWKAAPSKTTTQFCMRDTHFGSTRVAYLLQRGADPGHFFVCHTCDTPRCHNIAHFFLGTALDNNRDCISKGRNAKGDKNGVRLHPHIVRGERNGRAILTESIVLCIRAVYAKGGVSVAQLSRDFRITTFTAYDVIRRRTWTHLD